MQQNNMSKNDTVFNIAVEIFSAFDNGASFTSLPPDIEKQIIDSLELKSVRDTYIQKYTLETSTQENGLYVIYALPKIIKDILPEEKIKENDKYFDEVLGEVFRNLYQEIHEKTVHDGVSLLIHKHEEILAVKKYYSTVNMMIPLLLKLLNNENIELG